jgi:hypothetical protein
VYLGEGSIELHNGTEARTPRMRRGGRRANREGWWAHERPRARGHRLGDNGGDGRIIKGKKA